MFSGNRKWLNENLAPLHRYLEGQAGRPWNDVWSEICANINLDNTVQKHVRDHVRDFVAVNTSVRDGTIMTVSRYGGPQPLSGSRWMRLYVDPQTGILRRIPSTLSWRAERKLAEADEAYETSAPTAELFRVVDGCPSWVRLRLAVVGHRALISGGLVRQLGRDAPRDHSCRLSQMGRQRVVAPS